MKRLSLVIPAALLGSVVAAEDSALAQCARVDDAAARLACYDALAGRPPAPPGAALPATPGATGAAVPVPAPGTDTFGKQGVMADSLTARIVGKFNEWKFGTLIKLDNGQVWQSVETERSAVYPNVPENPEVEITKGMFGYRMEIKAIGRRIPVKRVS